MVDGLRVDSTRNVEQDFWPGFNSAAGVYCMGEVADGDVPYVCPYQNYIDGVLNYPS
jgi:alpha-amylase